MLPPATLGPCSGPRAGAAPSPALPGPCFPLRLQRIPRSPFPSPQGSEARRVSGEKPAMATRACRVPRGSQVSPSPPSDDVPSNGWGPSAPSLQPCMGSPRKFPTSSTPRCWQLCQPLSWPLGIAHSPHRSANTPPAFPIPGAGWAQHPRTQRACTH